MAATQEYFAEQDVFGQWLADECWVKPTDPNTWDTAKDLFEAWTAYAKSGGYPPGTTQRFGEQLVRRGMRREFQWMANKSVRVWRGIQLRRLTDNGQP
jgi:putative DNA primase/helicase